MVLTAIGQYMLIFAVRGVDISRLTVHRYMNTELQLFSIEYSCAMKSHFRKFGNQMSGSGNHLCNYASLLA